MTTPSAVHEVYALKYAERMGSRGHFFHGTRADPHDQPLPIDYFVWLIRSEDQDIVVDLGFQADVAAKRGRTHLRAPAEALALLGVDCSRVPLVILSHFHYDHVGDLTPFPTARFVVQDREMAFWTGRYASRREFRVVVEVADIEALVRANHQGRLLFVDGDAEVAPGVSVHVVGGHSPGLQVVKVDTAIGVVVLAVDASHFYTNIEQDAPFATLHNLADMYGAFDRLRALAGPNGIIVPGHDPEVLRRHQDVAGLEGIAVRIA